MIVGMIAVLGQEGTGRRKQLRGKPPKSQGEEWGGSEPAAPFSEQRHGVGWVSVPHEMETALLVSVTFQLWCRNNLS